MKEDIKIITPLCLGLPKTGQSTSYRTGDDGLLERGWWRGRLNANNRQRFIEKDYGTETWVVIDLATGLMWPKNWVGGGCAIGAKKNWNDALDWIHNLDWGGFNDWTMPNVLELMSIGNFGLQNPAIHTPFNNIQPDNYKGYWTSTTYIGNTTYAWYVRFTHNDNATYSKSGTTYLVPCRCLYDRNV